MKQIDFDKMREAFDLLGIQYTEEYADNSKYLIVFVDDFKVAYEFTTFGSYLSIFTEKD